MVTYLNDVLDPALLGQMMDEGYVQVRYHPDYPYAVYCYTKQAMFDHEWNDVTKVCRGLIVNEDTGEILARPFKKFFNYGEPDCPDIHPDEFVQVYDKVDGSLGIAYSTPNGLAIATKGSFTSEQAQHATELLRDRYGAYKPVEGITDLFEIVYPDNRIVLDYGDLDQLVYLGSVGVASGDSYYRNLDDIFPHAERGSFGVFAKVLPIYIDMKRPNAEGVVIHAEARDIRVKMKQEDYLELHKIMTGLNERQLWEWLNAGFTPTEVMKKIPEEMHGWARPIVGKITLDRYHIVKSVGEAYRYHKAEAVDRKDFALRIKDYPSLDKGVMFCWLDGQNERADELVWKAVKP